MPASVQIERTAAACRGTAVRGDPDAARSKPTRSGHDQVDAAELRQALTRMLSNWARRSAAEQRRQQAPRATSIRTTAPARGRQACRDDAAAELCAAADHGGEAKSAEGGMAGLPDESTQRHAASSDLPTWRTRSSPPAAPGWTITAMRSGSWTGEGAGARAEPVEIRFAGARGRRRRRPVGSLPPVCGAGTGARPAASSTAAAAAKASAQADQTATPTSAPALVGDATPTRSPAEPSSRLSSC